MADNFNINTTQDQSLIAGGLDPNSPAMTYVDFATQIASNAMRQKQQEQLIAQAVEQTKQAQLSTRQKTAADVAGVNPELADYLTKEQALAYLMQSWNVNETDPDIIRLNQVLPDMVNRFTIQTLLRKRSAGLGKEIGEPFKAEAKGVYSTTLDKTGQPAQLEAGQMYQAYLTEDGKINYIPSGAGYQGGSTGTFKPVGITKAGETVSPTREGQLIVKGKNGIARPWDQAVDGELEPFIAPTIGTGDLGDIQRLQASLEQFKIVRELFDEKAVGPVQDRLITLSQFTGVDLTGLFTESSAFDSKSTAFRTALQSSINDYIKAVTGAQMSEAEAARLQKAIPAAGKAQEAFLPALEEANRIIETKLDSKLALLEAAGFRNVGGMRSVLKERRSKPTTPKGEEPKKEEGKTQSVEDKKAALRAKLGLTKAK